MILKLDHVSYSCTTREVGAVITKKFQGYFLKFSDQIKNLPEKRQFMYYPLQESHEIYFMENPNGIDLEITAYGEIKSGKSFLSCEGDMFQYNILDIDKTARFWGAFGNVRTLRHLSGLELTFVNVLDQPPSKFLCLTGKEAQGNYLDSAGFCGWAFLCTHLEHHRSDFIDQGYVCTEINSLVVHNNLLNLFFVQGPNGEIVELFSFQRGNDYEMD